MYGSIKRSVTCVALKDVIDLCLTHLKDLSKLFSTWLSFMFLFESHVCFVCLVVGSDLILRKTNQPALLCQCLEDRLTDPPYRIGDEFETFGLIKSLCCLY